MSFAEAVRSVLRQYATFGGRARRAECWWFILFTALVSLAASTIDAVLGTMMQSGVGLIGGDRLVGTAASQPAVTVRRLHDTDRSGW